MMGWTRTSELGGVPRAIATERWDYRAAATSLSCEVEITIGKALDVLGLKGTALSDVSDYAAFLKATAARLYAPDAPRRTLALCPACGADTPAPDAITVFGQGYARCGTCGHGFVQQQPTAATLDAVFSGSDEHAAAYVDRAGLEIRLAQIIAPKADWVLANYRRLYGRAPRSALDVGAGGGHFVEGMRRRGIAAEGYERSRASRRFATEVFGVTLRDDDFLAAALEPRDVVTFWGLLEYVPEPRRFLDQARRCLAPENGLLIVEVPRLDCFGTAVQREMPENVARHMDPTSHMNAFTDVSLATVLIETGFHPVAAWYFGMDMYEFLVQAALRLGETRVFAELAELIAPLQASLDQGRQCDDLVIAARPA
jgi:2-polyprenyl-3-methyl-5-hydroxy-6-metoxy-1,4-benzoquinol methylase